MQARVFVVVSILMSTVGANAGEANPTQRLHAVFDRAWEFDLRDDPVAASQLGDKRFNQEWDDLSPQAWRSRDSQYTEFINEAQAVPSASLPEEEQLNRDLFVRMYQDQREQIRFKTYLRPLDQLNYSGGVLTANEAAETI